MKLLLATALLVCIAQAFSLGAGGQNINEIFTVGYEYRYKYQGQTLTSIPKVSPQQVGLGFQAEVVVQAYSAGATLIKIEQLVSGTVNQVLENLEVGEVPFQYGSQIEGPFSKPMIVTYDRGLIRSFETDSEEPETVTNVKKAILDSLQFKADDYFNNRFKKQASLNTRIKLNYGIDDTAVYNVMEEGIEGRCENKYSVEVNPWAGNPNAKTLNGTKVLNAKNCVDFIDWLVSTHPANNCTNCDADDIDVVSNVKTTTYQFNLDNDIVAIERIETVGQAIYTPLSANADEIQTNHSETFELLSVTPLSENYIRPTNTVKHDNLQYKFPNLEEGKEPTVEELVDAPVEYFPLDLSQQEIYEKVKQLISKVARNLVNDDRVPIIDTPQLAQQLSRAVRHLSAEYINKILEQFVLGKIEIVQPKVVREVALSAVVMSGSLPAASVLLDKVNHNEVPYLDQLRIMRDIPFYNRRPTVPLLDKVLRIAQSNRLHKGEQLYNTFWMAFASLVDQSCGPEDSSKPVSPGLESYCKQQDEQKYVQAIADELEKAQTKEIRVVLVNALKVITSEYVIHVLRPYVNGRKQVSEMVRVLALRAITNSASEDPQEVLRLSAPIFADSDETTVLRIAAFEAMLESAPDKHSLEKFAALIKDEDDDQLTNYVYTSLESYSNATHPCLKDISAHASHALNFIDEVSGGIQDSRLLINDDYDEELMLGNILRVATVANNESFIPRILQVEFNRSIAGYSQVPLKVTAYIEGLSSVISRIIGAKGAFEEFDIQKILKESYVETPKNYHDIFGKVSIEPRVDEALAIAIETQLLTTKRDLYYIDAAKILSIIQQGVQQMDMSSLLSQGVKIDYTKIVGLGTVKYQMPSTLGLPIFVQVKAPAIVNVVGQVSLQVTKSPIPGDIPREITVRANLKPTASVNVITTMGVINPFDKQYVAAGVSSQTYLRLPADVSVTLNTHDSKLTTTVKPQLSAAGKPEPRVFSHEVKPFTTVYKYNTFEVMTRDAKTILVKDELDVYEYKLSEELVGVKAAIKVKSDLFWQDQGSMLEYLTEKNTPLSLLNFWWATEDFKYREYVATVDAQAASTTVFKMDAEMKYLPSRIQSALRDGRQHKLQGLLGFATGWANLPWLCEMQQHEAFPQLSRQLDDDRKQPGATSGNSEQQADQPEIASSYQSRGGVSRLSSLLQSSGQKGSASSTIEKIPLNKQSAEDIVEVIVNLSVRGKHTRSIKAKLILNRNRVSVTDSLDFSADINNPAFSDDSFHQVCAKGQMIYPKFPCDIASSLYPRNIKPINGQLSINYGQTCAGQQKIGVKLEFSQPKEQIDDINARTMWFYRQCGEDFRAGKRLSDTCEQAALAVSELNKLIVSVDYQDVPRPVLNISHKIDHFLKYYFYNHMSNNPVGVDNGQGKLKVKVIFAGQAASLDLKVYKAKENTFFSKIYYPAAISPFLKPISVRQSFLRRNLDDLTNGYAPPTCKLMKRHIESFDNVTYPVHLSECSHVLTKDCSADDLFSVLVKKTGVESSSKQLGVHLLNHKIYVQPSDRAHTGRFDLMIDNEPVTISQNEVLIMKSQDHSRSIASILIDGDKIVITAPYKQLVVKFDGENVKVQVGNEWRGSLCGLCGELEGDSSNALIGPQFCEYASTKDFSLSYVVRNEHCDSPRPDSLDKLCPNQRSPTNYQMKKLSGRAFHHTKKSNHHLNPFMDTPLLYGTHVANSIQRNRRLSDSQMKRLSGGALHYTPKSSHYENPSMDTPIGDGDKVSNSILRYRRLTGIQDLCFSDIPLPECNPGFVSGESRQKEHLFYCYPESEREYAENLAEQLPHPAIVALEVADVTYVTETILIPTRCDEEEIPDTTANRFPSPSSEQTNMPYSWPRNFVISRGTETCFSIKNYPTCRPGFVMEAHEVHIADFRCFDPTYYENYVKQLLQAQPNRPLTELLNTENSFSKHVKIHVKVPTMCAKHPNVDLEQENNSQTGGGQNQTDIRKSTTQRNRQLPPPDNFCFSIESVPTCLPGYIPKSQVIYNMPFHCFPKESASHVKQLAAALPKRPLTELIGIKFSFRRNIMIPQYCIDKIPNSVQRNKQLSPPENFCFSIISMPTCILGYVPVRSERQNIPYYCFPTEDAPFVGILEKALPNRPLTELRDSDITFWRTSMVPTLCGKRNGTSGDTDRPLTGLSETFVSSNKQVKAPTMRVIESNENNTVQRNNQLPSPDNLCFSIESVATCIPDYDPKGMMPYEMPFHCFRQENASYVSLLEAALPNRPLTELIGAKVSFKRSMMIPTRCVQPIENEVPNSEQRNKQLSPPENFCFSIISMTTCIPGFLPVRSLSQNIPYHCFPKKDAALVRTLEKALPHRPLNMQKYTEIAFWKISKVPTLCIERDGTYSDQHTDHSTTGIFWPQTQGSLQQSKNQSQKQEAPDVEHAVYRNLYDQDLCFSIESLAKCLPGFIADDTINYPVKFHCFPAERREWVDYLASQVNERPLWELQGESVTKTITMPITISCSQQ